MKFSFKTIDQSAVSAGATVLLAIDLNMPVANGKIVDDFRLRRTMPTLELLQKSGAKTLLLGHLADRESETLSLLPISEHLNKFFPTKLADNFTVAKTLIEESKPGEFVMLENTRRFKGEIENDEKFAKELSSLGSVYVNDSFSVSHRAHASIIGVPKFLPSYAGLLFADEVSHLSEAFDPPRPFVFVLAGAKFETKFPLVKKFLGIADSVFIGGALANDLLKAKGYEIGLSKHSGTDFGFKDILRSPKLIFPIDVVTKTAGKKVTKKPADILPGDTIFDVGPRTVTLLAKKFATAKFILWNGTLGIYEQGFAEGTEALAGAIVGSSAETIVGGGDTLAVIDRLNLSDRFSFVSTGGGAMLEFLAKGTLPGILALESSWS